MTLTDPRGLTDTAILQMLPVLPRGEAVDAVISRALRSGVYTPNLGHMPLPTNASAEAVKQLSISEPSIIYFGARGESLEHKYLSVSWKVQLVVGLQQEDAVAEVARKYAEESQDIYQVPRVAWTGVALALNPVAHRLGVAPVGDELCELLTTAQHGYVWKMLPAAAYSFPANGYASFPTEVWELLFHTDNGGTTLRALQALPRTMFLRAPSVEGWCGGHWAPPVGDTVMESACRPDALEQIAASPSVLMDASGVYSRNAGLDIRATLQQSTAAYMLGRALLQTVGDSSGAWLTAIDLGREWTQSWEEWLEVLEELYP